MADTARPEYPIGVSIEVNDKSTKDADDRALPKEFRKMLREKAEMSLRRDSAPEGDLIDSSDGLLAGHSPLAQRVEQIEDTQEDMLSHVDNFQSLLKKGGSETAALLSNPKAAIGGNVLGLVSGAGPIGVAVTTAIATGVAIYKIIEQLNKRGGPLDEHWRRTFSANTNDFRSLQQQKDRLDGTAPLVIARRTGYRPVPGTATYNSLLNVDEIRLRRAGQNAFGLGLQ